MQVTKSVRLPKTTVRKIEKVAQEEGSTFGQFMRTAAINELKRKKVA